MNLFGNKNLSDDDRKSGALLDQFPKKRNLQRYMQVFSGLALTAASTFTFGLGLGDIEPKSFLGQPLAANIDLISLDGDIDPETLLVRQVSKVEAEKMGVEIFYSTYHFDMKIDQSSGQSKVTVISKESIDEPYLNILVELRWPSGVVYREYPVLLDPPPRVPVSNIESRDEAKVKNEPAVVRQAIKRPARTSAAPTRASVGNKGVDLDAVKSGSGDEYKVQSGDTLWQIAKELSKGSSLSVNDTMAWLHQNNSSAFSRGDMNRLKAGARLKMPDLSSLDLEDTLLSTPARALSESDASAPLEPVSAQDSKKQELAIDEVESFNDAGKPEQGLLVVNSDQTDDQSRELIDMLTRENEDLKKRMSNIEDSEYLDTLTKLVSLQKRQISELRAELGVQDTNSEEMSSLLDQADVDVNAPVDTQGSLDSELSSIGEEETLTEEAPVENTVVSDDASLVQVESPLANPPEATADKSLFTWLIVGGGAFLAMIFAFLLIYYRKMAGKDGDEYADDYEDEGTISNYNPSSHSGSFSSSTDKDDMAVEDRVPDIGYDGEDKTAYVVVEEDSDWLGEKVEDVDAFDAGAFDSAIQEVEDIFDSISEGERDATEDATQIKGRTETDIRSSIAEKMSQYDPADFSGGAGDLGLLDIDDAAMEDIDDIDEVDATINRAKMFCEFSQFDRAHELIEKSMGDLPDARYSSALEDIEAKKLAATEEQGTDDEDASSDDQTVVLMDGFEGRFDEDATEVLSSNDDDIAGDLLEGALSADLLSDVVDDDDLDLDLDIDVDFDDASLDSDIQIDSLDDEGGKKKPVSC